MLILEKHYYTEASLFLEKLFSELKSLDVNYTAWDIDHLCFRTDSLVHYDNIKLDFSKFADLLVEAPVNGRPIATYKLKSPWIFQDHFIDLVEIPAPKPNKVTKAGFEHIEIVVAKSFLEIEKLYPNLAFEKNNNHKKFNPELVANLKTGDIKFHHQSLEAVINIEKLEAVLENLQDKFHFPNLPFFICGTLPIGLGNQSSDIDVIVTYNREDKIKILEWIQTFQDKTLSPRLQIHNDIMVFHFKYDAFIYEFYFSTENLFEQNAYRHMNLEMRLLKIFGEPLKKRVLKLKEEKFNTEHAFLSALGIEIDSLEAFQKIYSIEDLGSDKKIFELTVT